MRLGILTFGQLSISVLFALFESTKNRTVHCPDLHNIFQVISVNTHVFVIVFVPTTESKLIFVSSVFVVFTSSFKRELVHDNNARTYGWMQDTMEREGEGKNSTTQP